MMAALLFCLCACIFLLSPKAHAWTTKCATLSTLGRRPSFSTSLQASVPAVGQYNVVLHPAVDDENAFDSFKIGNARVHRYSRDNDPESEIEYVMWYHGRSQTMQQADQFKDIPPLSTGRIGRATSKNGLVWQKDRNGSASEDAPDVCLGLNQDSWWGFDTAHVGLGSVLLPMSTPAVLTEGGVYLMYYMGGSFDATPVRNYIEKDDIPESLTMQGMKMKIGVAVSQDGTTWGRVEGDDPSGACMVPFDRSDRNAMLFDAPADMEEELYCAWPEVMVNPDGGDEAFFMYYSTMTKQAKQKCLAVATSPDGFRWFKKGLCLRPDTTKADSLDVNGCARCCVLRDATYNEETGQWQEDQENASASWTMYYEGVAADNKHRILTAVSSDGIHWTKKGLALDVGGPDEAAWDSAGVGSPHMVRMDDGSLRMYYTGQGGADGSHTAIGVAKLEEGESQWVREQATITFATE